MRIDYNKTAYVEVEDGDVFEALKDRSAWCMGEATSCQTTENLKGIKEDTPNDSPLGEFLIELLTHFHNSNFDGDVIFEVTTLST